MTRRLHVLTRGFIGNTRAMLFPLIANREELGRRQIEVRMFTAPRAAMFDCDVLMIESGFHGKRWLDDTPGIIAELVEYGKHACRLYYFDASDSTALLHPEVLPCVERYFKSQLLVDRTQYKDLHYGRRLFTDFAHKTFGVEDDVPEKSIPVTDPAHLDKLCLLWNSALANWSPMGRYRTGLYARLPFRPLLAYPDSFTTAASPRSNDVSCRMETSYGRETVAWNRKAAKKQLAKWAPSDRVSYGKYMRELQSSKIVASPFGWGEINYKDYETFLAGALLVKPDMSHLETWPDLYRPHETFCPYEWDTEGLPGVIEDLLSDPARACDMATAGQNNYRAHIVGQAARNLFCDRLAMLMGFV